MFKWYFFTLQKAPFRLAKWPVSEAEKHHIAPWNRLFRTTKWAISESKMHLFGLWYGVYRKAIHSKTGVIMLYLTFIYISFEKIFCQNFVKKNCKYTPWVSSENTDMPYSAYRVMDCPKLWNVRSEALIRTVQGSETHILRAPNILSQLPFEASWWTA